MEGDTAFLGGKLVVTEEQAQLKHKGYSLGQVIGEGAFARVRTAYGEKCRGHVAIKIINQRRAPKELREKFLPRELDIIQTVKHPHIIKTLEIFRLNGKVYIVMEMAGHGDLLDYIKLRGFLSATKAAPMFRNLVDGVSYLHSNLICHRDLKCENLLLDVNNAVKISDFGFARRFKPGEQCHTFCGSTAYAAPEVLQGKPYDPTMYDTWSLGVVLYIMVCGVMPYDDSNIRQMIRRQTEQPVNFFPVMNPGKDVENLVHSILKPNPRDRLSIEEISAHPWLSLEPLQRKTTPKT